MALGDVYVFDDAEITFAGTDVSAAVAQARIHITHVVAQSPHTFQRRVQTAEASRNYSWTVEFDFVTDAFGSATMDGVVRATMRPPLGAATGKAAIKIKPGSGAKAATNPSFEGTVLVDQWEPLGDGTATEIIRQTRTFTGVSELTVDTTP